MTQPDLLLTSTDTTDFGYLTFFIADADGCTVRYGIEQTRFRLNASHVQYSAMYSLLLACWLDRARVSLEFRLRKALPGSSEVPPREIVAITALPAGSDG